MANSSIKARIVACTLASCVLLAPAEIRAQASSELTPTGEIPHGYSSWSLFLVCNPAWIIQNGDAGIAELFNEYRVFGRTIGAKNLAIWFWKKRAIIPTVENTDVERGSEYCARYKLGADGSPQILVTTKYPDDPAPGDQFVVKLNGLDAHNSALALTKLVDQLLVTGLNQSGLDVFEWWRRILTAAGSAVSATGCYFNKVSFSIKAGPLNADIEHSKDSASAGSRC